MRRASLWVLALVACGLPEVSQEGAHVRLAADPEMLLCGDPVAHMDEFVERTAAALERTPPTGAERITYYLLRDGDFDARTICVMEHGGCAVGGDVYMTWTPHDHELVHALVWDEGVAAPFFIEGLAVAFQLLVPTPLIDPSPWSVDDPADPGQPISDVAIAEAIPKRDKLWLPGSLYPLAGAFTAFLLDRHGAGPYLRVYQRLQYSDNAGLVSRVLEEELGEGLEALAAVFDATRRDCPEAGFNRKVIECGAPELEWDGVILTDHRTLDCDDPTVVGPFQSETIVVHRTVTLTEDARYTVRVIGDVEDRAMQNANGVELIRCGGCEGYAHVEVRAGAEPRSVMLPAGKYALRYRGPADRVTGVGVRIERAPE